MLGILSFEMVYGAVISFSGIAMLTLPFADTGIFQVSIAVFDLLSATSLAYLALDIRS
jgi:hypothetical protein